MQIHYNCILSEAWEKVIKQIRKIEGFRFSNFLQASSLNHQKDREFELVDAHNS
jgi:hypothetical protein